MPISLQCPCGKRYTVQSQLGGKTVKCGGCGKSLQVPIQEAVPVAQTDSTVNVTCACGQGMRVNSAHAGGYVNCPQCLQAIVVPGTSPSGPAPKPTLAIRNPVSSKTQTGKNENSKAGWKSVKKGLQLFFACIVLGVVIALFGIMATLVGGVSLAMGTQGVVSGLEVSPVVAFLISIFFELPYLIIGLVWVLACIRTMNCPQVPQSNKLLKASAILIGVYFLAIFLGLLLGHLVSDGGTMVTLISIFGSFIESVSFGVALFWCSGC